MPLKEEVDDSNRPLAPKRSSIQYCDYMDTQAGELSGSRMFSATDLFRLLSDRNRLRIVPAIVAGGYSAFNFADDAGAGLSIDASRFVELYLARIPTMNQRGTLPYRSTVNELIQYSSRKALVSLRRALGRFFLLARSGSHRRSGRFL